MVISIAGYGRPMTWKEDTVIPKDHKITFTDAITTVSKGLRLKLALPNWVLSLRKEWRYVRDAYDELDVSCWYSFLVTRARC